MPQEDVFTTEPEPTIAAVRFYVNGAEVDYAPGPGATILSVAQALARDAGISTFRVRLDGQAVQSTQARQPLPAEARSFAVEAMGKSGR